MLAVSKGPASPGLHATPAPSLLFVLKSCIAPAPPLYPRQLCLPLPSRDPPCQSIRRSSPRILRGGA